MYVDTDFLGPWSWLAILGQFRVALRTALKVLIYTVLERGIFFTSWP